MGEILKNYLELMRHVMHTGIDKSSRAGDTRSIFGATLEFDLSKGFPIITTRQMPLRIAFEETWMFLRGETNTKVLENKNINIWKGHTSREFLDSNGLTYLPEGSLGTGYSHQWRNFSGTLGNKDGIDQINLLLEGLLADPNGRRHIVCSWNPQQLSGMALPPCHLYNQYAVNNGKLDSSFVMRSNDVYHGLGFNIMGYALLNIVFAKYLGLEPGKLVYFGNDVHIYHTQFDVVKVQLSRTPRVLPTLTINKELNSLEDILALEFTDLQLSGYNPLPPLAKVPMSI